jgi:hypothetical protein
MGKSALISGTGSRPGPEVVEANEIAWEPVAAAVAAEPNWTVGTETKPSSKVLAMDSSSSVAGRVAVLAANESGSLDRALPTGL